MTYDPDGQYVSREVTSDPAVIARCRAQRDLALACSVDLKEFLQEASERLREASPQRQRLGRALRDLATVPASPAPSLLRNSASRSRPSAGWRPASRFPRSPR